jgi:hypothetical protein
MFGRVSKTCSALLLSSIEQTVLSSRWLRWSSSAPHHIDGKVLHPDLLNGPVKRAEYAVRGELYLKAMQLQQKGMKIVFTNGARVSNVQICLIKRFLLIRDASATV